MRDGFISVAAGTPKIRVEDCRYNAEQIFTLMREADKQGVKVLALPELCLTGYTCGDLFLQDTLLRGAEEGLQTILEATRNLEIVTALGLPVWDKWDNKLYNCAAIIQKEEILGLIPKVYLPNYGEFYEQRWFASGSGVEHGIELCGQHVSLCTNQTFACDTMPNLVIGVEICEDLWAPAPPSVELARKGATVILNLSASNELVGKADYRRSLVTGQSARLMCGYVYADAGEGESTTDVVFTGHNMIAENGTLLAERRFATGLTVSEIDVDRLIHDRRRTNTFTFGKEPPEIWRCGFTLPVEETRLTRYVSPSPFVPEDAAGRAERCEEILRIASLGLKKRLEHTGAKTAVVGLSGGLDSTLALLITALAMGMLNRPASDIVAVTMPCFGTTARTKSNAELLAERMGATLKIIDISQAVRRHFTDIGQSMENHDVTFENGQARERTQVLMDDILDTPVSPELLPAVQGEISQRTEDLVGPYELHDFFLYYMLRWGFPPRKIYRLALYALGKTYTPDVILKWLKTFYRRFFSQQFKRSCLPDGPKVGSAALSPRGDWRMPSDASAALWQAELETLESVHF